MRVIISDEPVKKLFYTCNKCGVSSTPTEGFLNSRIQAYREGFSFNNKDYAPLCKRCDTDPTPKPLNNCGEIFLKKE